MIEPDTLALLASIVLATAGVAVAAMTRKGRAGTQAGQENSDDLLAKVRSAKADISELMRQLELAGDRLEAKVDSRLEELRGLIAEARRKAGELQALVADLPPHMAKKPVRLGKAKSDDVLAMSDQGIDPVEIARKLSMDVGEVELLVSLRRSQKSSPAREAEVRE